MTKESGMLGQELRLQDRWLREDLADLGALSVRAIRRGRARACGRRRCDKAARRGLRGLLPFPECVRHEPAEHAEHRQGRGGCSRAMCAGSSILITTALQLVALAGVLAVMNYFTSPAYPWVLRIALVRLCPCG
jgi:hypothetical protein